MAWAIITNYTSKCAQMDTQQLPKTSKFYSRSKKCDIEKTVWGGYHPLGSPKVKSYLTNGSQCVVVNGTSSCAEFVKHGVLQGSILGPFHFILYINDLPNSSSILSFIVFAHDTSLFYSNKT